MNDHWSPAMREAIDRALRVAANAAGRRELQQPVAAEALRQATLTLADALQTATLEIRRLASAADKLTYFAEVAAASVDGEHRRTPLAQAASRALAAHARAQDRVKRYFDAIEAERARARRRAKRR